VVKLVVEYSFEKLSSSKAIGLSSILTVDDTNSIAFTAYSIYALSRRNQEVWDFNE
jgi:hypothetical protein